MSSPTVLASAGSPARSDESFVDSLRAVGPHASLGDAADVYGWLAGSWDVQAVDYEPDGTRHESAGEWHFAWVLAGRAVQDVFIVPRRDAPDAAGAFRVRYGTTVRVCDPASGAWRIVWFNPVTGAENHLVGRRVGRDVMQDGALEDGTPIRWSFVDITADAFTWRGETSTDGGQSWRLDAEFFCRRAGSAPSAAALANDGRSSGDAPGRG